MKKKPTTDLVITFDNAHMADRFMAWLSNSGEQEYWQAVEDEEPEDIANDFDYDQDKFTIRATHRQ